MSEWDDAIDDYADWLRASGSSPTTQRLRRHYVGRLAQSVECSPWEVTQDQLVRMLSAPHWAPETRKSARSAVRGFYGWAMDSARITSDPSRSLPRIRVPQGAPRPTPQYVVTAALGRAKGKYRTMLLLALLAGLRRGEIARVHTSDLTPDLVGYSLRVKGKGGRVRNVPLHPALVTDLTMAEPGYLFPGRDNGHLSPDWVGKRLKQLLGPGWSGHTLRHRFATEAYAAERDLFAVQRLLGHSKPETTARYTAIPDDSLRKAVSGLDSWAA